MREFGAYKHKRRYERFPQGPRASRRATRGCIDLQDTARTSSIVARFPFAAELAGRRRPLEGRRHSLHRKRNGNSNQHAQQHNILHHHIYTVGACTTASRHTHHLFRRRKAETKVPTRERCCSRYMCPHRNYRGCPHPTACSPSCPAAKASNVRHQHHDRPPTIGTAEPGSVHAQAPYFVSPLSLRQRGTTKAGKNAMIAKSYSSKQTLWSIRGEKKRAEDRYLPASGYAGAPSACIQ